MYWISTFCNNYNDGNGDIYYWANIANNSYGDWWASGTRNTRPIRVVVQ